MWPFKKKEVKSINYSEPLGKKALLKILPSYLGDWYTGQIESGEKISNYRVINSNDSSRKQVKDLILSGEIHAYKGQFSELFSKNLLCFASRGIYERFYCEEIIELRNFLNKCYVFRYNSGTTPIFYNHEEMAELLVKDAKNMMENGKFYALIYYIIY